MFPDQFNNNNEVYMCVCLWNGKKEIFFVVVVVNKHCEKMVKQTKTKKSGKKIANKQNFSSPKCCWWWRWLSREI